MCRVKSEACDGGLGWVLMLGRVPGFAWKDASPWLPGSSTPLGKAGEVSQAVDGLRWDSVDSVGSNLIWNPIGEVQLTRPRLPAPGIRTKAVPNTKFMTFDLDLTGVKEDQVLFRQTPSIW